MFCLFKYQKHKITSLKRNWRIPISRYLRQFSLRHAFKRTENFFLDDAPRILDFHTCLIFHSGYVGRMHIPWCTRSIFLKFRHETLKSFTTMIDLYYLQMHVFPKWGSVTHVRKGREPLSRKTTVWLKKPKICLTIPNWDALSKASQKRTFLGEVYQKTLTMMLTWKPS